jgi:hypothetical protein
VTTRWIISAFVFALLLLLLSAGATAARITRRSRSASAGYPAFAAGWPRPAARRSSATGSAAHAVRDRRANILLFFGASDFFSAVSYAVTGLITMDAILFAVVVGPIYGIGVWFGASLFGKASEAVFRSICYALIAAAVIFGLPALDGVLR